MPRLGQSITRVTPNRRWSHQEEAALLAGVQKHGAGKWQLITMDPDPWIGPPLRCRSNVDLKDKWRNIRFSAGGQKRRGAAGAGPEPAAPFPGQQQHLSDPQQGIPLGGDGSGSSSGSELGMPIRPQPRRASAARTDSRQSPGASRPVSVGGGTARRRSEDEPHDAGMSDAAEGLAAMARQQSCPPGWGSAAGGDGASAAAGADAGVRGQGAAEGMPGFGWQAYQSGHGGRMEASAFSSGGGNYDPMFAAALAAASGGGGGAAAAPAAALWLQPPQQPTSWEAAQLLQMRAQLHLQQRLLGAWATNQQQRQQQQRQQQQRRQQAAKKKTAAGKASATEQFQSYSWGLREESLAQGLRAACASLDAGAAEACLRAGAAAGAPDAVTRRTPAHELATAVLAAGNGNGNALRAAHYVLGALLQCGAQVEVQDIVGFTPLQLAHGSALAPALAAAAANPAATAAYLLQACGPGTAGGCDGSGPCRASEAGDAAAMSTDGGGGGGGGSVSMLTGAGCAAAQAVTPQSGHGSDASSAGGGTGGSASGHSIATGPGAPAAQLSLGLTPAGGLAPASGAGSAAPLVAYRSAAAARLPPLGLGLSVLPLPAHAAAAAAAAAFKQRTPPPQRQQEQPAPQQQQHGDASHPNARSTSQPPEARWAGGTDSGFRSLAAAAGSSRSGGRRDGAVEADLQQACARPATGDDVGAAAIKGRRRSSESERTTA